MEYKPKGEEDWKLYENSMAFWGDLAFKPDMREHGELDKNVTTTNLRSRFKEPDMARRMLNAFHILKEYTVKKTIRVTDGEGNERDVMVEVFKYPKISRKLRNQFQTLITTAKARDGWMVTEYNKSRIEKSETIEDKTESKRGFASFFQRKHR